MKKQPRICFRVMKMMKKKSKPIFNGAENLAALVYLCAISTVMMYLICRDYMLITTIVMTALCSGVYMLFYAVRNRRIISFVTFVTLMAGMMLAVSSVSAVKGRFALMEFIYGETEVFDAALAGASIVMFAFIVTYPVFYFTVKLPRPCFLLLPALAPLILGARTVGALPAWLMAFMAASYFFAVMGVSRVEYPLDNRYVDDPKAKKERLITMSIMVVAAALLIVIIPRSDRTPYAKYLDATRFTGQQFYGTRAMSGFSQSSTPNTGDNQPSTDVLFYITTENPRSIISQSFDRYRGKDGWRHINDLSIGHRDWTGEQRLLNYALLSERLRSAAEDGKLEEYAGELLKIPAVSQSSLRSSNMTIQVTDGSDTNVVRHPSGTFAALIGGRNLPIYRNTKDEIFTEENFGRNATYWVSFYAADPPAEFSRYVSGLDQLEYYALLDEATEEEVISEEEATAFKNDYREAFTYYARTLDSAITPRIKALATNITAGLDNDYDKAKAIEAWFGEENFAYDLNFVPQELTAEYFLFTSKRGICTDFATASALLLRAAGVPARYTEGFLIKTDIASMDLYGRYEIKADQAHAFATAYIPGGGWLEIDGTKYALIVSEQKEAQRRVFYVAAAAGVAAILCFIFRKRLSEAFFVIRYKLGRDKKRIRALYLRTRKIACGISGTDPKSTTSGEVCGTLSRTLSLGTEAAEITTAADAFLYGAGTENIDAKKLFADYKLIRKRSKKRK